MKKIVGLFVLIIGLSSCKSQLSLSSTAIQETEIENEELSGNFQNELYKKKKDSIAKIMLRSKTNPILVKNAAFRQKNKFDNIEYDMTLFIKKVGVIDSAKCYLGTKYYFGGTTEKGIDCSALILNAYKKNDFSLPRTSRDQSKLGEKVKRKKADIGDLIFFKTTRKNAISHVGMIVENHKGAIKFIHASSSQGVTITSLDNVYFKKRFAKIKRIIN